MARINIEDSIYRDQRFVDLCIAVGSLDAALGALVRAWSLAQRYYTKDDRRIPRDEWDKQRLPVALLEVGLAIDTNGRVRVSGADEQFKWLCQRVEAGRRGGNVKAVAKRSLAVAKRNKAVAKPLPLSSSLSSLSSNSNSISFSENTTPAPADADAVQNPVKFYCDAYKVRYGHSPTIGPKQAGILTRVRKSFPSKWQELISGYLAMPDSWAVQRSHPVEMLESKLNEITRFLATGKVMTRAMTKELEEKVDDKQETGKIDFAGIAEAYEQRHQSQLKSGADE